MEAHFEERSGNLSSDIQEFGNIFDHPVMDQLMTAMKKIRSENPQYSEFEIMDALTQQQRPQMPVRDNLLLESEGIYSSNPSPEVSDTCNTSYAMNHKPAHVFGQHQPLQFSAPVEDDLQQLNLNSHGNKQCFTINMDDLKGDPMDVAARQRPVRGRKKATSRSIAHDHQYSSSTLGPTVSPEASMYQTANSTCRVPHTQGMIFSSDEVLPHFPITQQPSLSIHPQVAPEMEDVFHGSHSNYSRDYYENDSLTLDEAPNFPTPLFPNDLFNATTAHMTPLAVIEPKEESLSPASPELSFQLGGQYGNGDLLHLDDQSGCISHESSRAGTPAQFCSSNSNLASPFLQVTYSDGTATPSPYSQQSSNYDSLLSPTPSCSSNYTNPSPSPSPSVRGRSRNISGKRPGSRRLSLVNMSPDQKHARVRGQNNKASRDYRMRKKGKLAEMEAEAQLLEEKKEEQLRTFAETEKKVKLLKQFFAICQERGISPRMAFLTNE